MALPQAFLRDVGGTIYLDAPVRSTAGVPAPTVVVRNSGNAAIVAATAATLDAASTTMTPAVAIGDRVLTVASTANFVAGRRYRLGPANPATASEGVEWVTVREVASGTVLNLRGPTLYAHAAAAPLVSTRLSYVVTAAQASALFWDGHAEWDLDATSHPENVWTGVECVLRLLHNLCTVADVARRDPILFRRLKAEQDPEALVQVAFEDVMEALGGSFRARTLIGSDALVVPTTYRTLLEIAQQQGNEAAMTRYAELLAGALTTLRSTRPADLDQDGVVEPHEAAYETIRVDRA